MKFQARQESSIVTTSARGDVKMTDRVAEMPITRMDNLKDNKRCLTETEGLNPNQRKPQNPKL